MPVTIVCGGQFGSEGKGKVSHYLVREECAKAVVRVGGSNSGHTVVADDGRVWVFRHLPTAAVEPDTVCVLPAGSYIDLGVLLEEIRVVNLVPERLVVDPKAVIVTEAHRSSEKDSGLVGAVGSTGSGTGAALSARISRRSPVLFSRDLPELKPYVKPVVPFLRSLLAAGERVLIEGTQGYGLSVIHSPHYPYVTARDTTAAGFLSETGLSPRDVDRVCLVIRAFPIRVAGNSGPLPRETHWDVVSRESGAAEPQIEYTSVTKRIRRVAGFDPMVVRDAIETNNPTQIVMNHLDYVDIVARTVGETPGTRSFVKQVQESIGRGIDLVGYGRNILCTNALGSAVVVHKAG